MPHTQEFYGRSPEAVLVGLARSGDRDAFAELVRQRQAWIRNLMRRCCGDITLANDLAQQVFVQAWRTIPQVQRPRRFAGWLKRIAINVWLQHLRKSDPLEGADENIEILSAQKDATAIAIDLDRALATLAHPVRLCIVLSYHERMTHEEIAEMTGMPLGTIKSHIRRGTQRLQKLLSAYQETTDAEDSQ